MYVFMCTHYAHMQPSPRAHGYTPYTSRISILSFVYTYIRVVYIVYSSVQEHTLFPRIYLCTICLYICVYTYIRYTYVKHVSALYFYIYIYVSALYLYIYIYMRIHFIRYTCIHVYIRYTLYTTLISSSSLVYTRALAHSDVYTLLLYAAFPSCLRVLFRIAVYYLPLS
jgi:hypothetical protein